MNIIAQCCEIQGHNPTMRSALVPESNPGGTAGECTQNHTRIGNLSRRFAAENAEGSEGFGGMVEMLTVGMLECWNAGMLEC